MSLVRIVIAGAATALSAVLLAILVADHMTGSEVEGVVVAAIAVIVGVAGIVSLMKGGAGRRVVIGLWLLVALGGGIGYLDHGSLPKPGHPVLDDRPRPPLAPLVFTVIGLAGAASLLRLPATPRDRVPAGAPQA